MGLIAEAVENHSPTVDMAREWLVWLGIGTSTTLQKFGYSSINAQIIFFAFFLMWVFINIKLKELVKSFLGAVLGVFFREVESTGWDKVPPGPIIFACAPHANQFVDPMVVQRCANRDVSYLIAAASLRRPFVGRVARALDAIGVERPQDIASVGSGTVSSSTQGDRFLVTGKGTEFVKQCRPGDTLVTKEPKLSGVVKAVLSDTELELKKAVSSEEGDHDVEMRDQAFKVLPHIDQSQMFREVSEHLRNNGAIGIFPEGGSHDRTELLGLKAGVAIMALDTVAKYPDCPVKVVPVGLNYFKGHQFRSRVLVEFGDPIEIPLELTQRFKEGGENKRAATGELLERILQGILSVTVQAPDTNTLQLMIQFRRLYTQRDHQVSIAESNTLVRAFSEGYQSVKEDIRVVRLKQKVDLYNDLLDDYGELRPHLHRHLQKK